MKETLKISEYLDTFALNDILSIFKCTKNPICLEPFSVPQLK